MDRHEIKALFARDRVFDVTNHIVTDDTHPLYGITRRKVVEVTERGVVFDLVSRRLIDWVEFPPPVSYGSARLTANEDGVVQFFNEGGELFLTFRPMFD